MRHIVAERSGLEDDRQQLLATAKEPAMEALLADPLYRTFRAVLGDDVVADGEFLNRNLAFVGQNANAAKVTNWSRR
jgi:hypothetical protein